MIYKVNSQEFISNTNELAQRKLKNHQQKGEQSSLSIFEVAYLMDILTFKADNQSSNNSQFEFCFN